MSLSIDESRIYYHSNPGNPLITKYQATLLSSTFRLFMVLNGEITEGNKQKSIKWYVNSQIFCFYKHNAVINLSGTDNHSPAIMVIHSKNCYSLLKCSILRDKYIMNSS